MPSASEWATFERLEEGDVRRACTVADLGHVFGVRLEDVRRWLAWGGLEDRQAARLLEVRDGLELAGEDVGTGATCAAMHALRRGVAYVPPVPAAAAPEPLTLF